MSLRTYIFHPNTYTAERYGTADELRVAVVK